MKLALSLSVAALTAVVGCSHDDDDHSHGSSSGGHTSAFASCQAIIDACHPLDDGNNEGAHACHDLAHDPSASEASCAAEKDRCLGQACVAGAVDAGTDAATTNDAGAGGS